MYYSNEPTTTSRNWPRNTISWLNGSPWSNDTNAYAYANTGTVAAVTDRALLRDVYWQLERLGRQIEALKKQSEAHLAVVLTWLRERLNESIELWREGPPRPAARTSTTQRRGRAVALSSVWRLARAPP